MIFYTPPPTCDLSVLQQPDIGCIVTPDSYRPGLYDLSEFSSWVADNACFAAGEKFDDMRYMRWLQQLRMHRDTCKFATAPDVVGDAEKTWERSREWLGALRVLGYQAAFIAQDGINPLSLDWSRFDVLFVGGSTEFKLSDLAVQCIRLAQEYQKWTHVGRVNSWRRLKWCLELGVDSVDGTFLKFGPLVNIPRLRQWLWRVKIYEFMGDL